MKTNKVNPANFNRLAAAIMEHHSLSYEDALEYLERMSLNIICGKEIANSEALQSALITAINTGKRAFLGGVFIQLPDNTKPLFNWEGNKTLNEICIDLGGNSNFSEKVDSFSIYIGERSKEDENSIEVIANGWQGGVVPYGFNISLDQSVDFSLGGILAGALGVYSAFMKLTGINICATDKPLGFSLWKPNSKDWSSREVCGPRLEYLPKNFWLLGLGHLGQAYTWTLGLLPFKNKNEVNFLLQDFDQIEEGNFSSGILCEKNDVEKYKTRLCSGWLEKRGFQTKISERTFDAFTKRTLDEPYVALCGFDNAEGRSLLENAGFDLIIECGIGGSLTDFDNFKMHSFPSQLKSAKEIWGIKSNDEPLLNKKVFEEFTTTDECGILAQDIASKAISSSFIGIIASTFVVAELLKGINGGSKIDKMNLNLRSISDRIILDGLDYSQEMAKNGYVPC